MKAKAAFCLNPSALCSRYRLSQQTPLFTGLSQRTTQCPSTTAWDAFVLPTLMCRTWLSADKCLQLLIKTGNPQISGICIFAFKPMNQTRSEQPFLPYNQQKLPKLLSTFTQLLFPPRSIILDIQLAVPQLLSWKELQDWTKWTYQFSLQTQSHWMLPAVENSQLSFPTAHPLCVSYS